MPIGGPDRTPIDNYTQSMRSGLLRFSLRLAYVFRTAPESCRKRAVPARTFGAISGRRLRPLAFSGGSVFECAVVLQGRLSAIANAVRFKMLLGVKRRIAAHDKSLDG
jgi:hypothetical protein